MKAYQADVFLNVVLKVQKQTLKWCFWKITAAQNYSKNIRMKEFHILKEEKATMMAYFRIHKFTIVSQLKIGIWKSLSFSFSKLKKMIAFFSQYLFEENWSWGLDKLSSVFASIFVFVCNKTICLHCQNTKHFFS